MSVTALEHVLVLSDDIEATRDFYRQAVGLTVGERPPLPFPGFWLYAGATPCVHVAERAAYLAHAATLGLTPPAGASAPSVDHISFTAADRRAVQARLRAAGVDAVANEVAGGTTAQLFFEDPNGVRLEINVKSPLGSAGSP